MRNVNDERFVVVVEALSATKQRHRIVHRHSRTALRWEEVVQLWKGDEPFALFFSATLAATFDAFFWECPAVNALTVARPFEYVLTQRPDGFDDADPSAFATHFTGTPGAATCTFANLTRDATLVAPTGDPVLAEGATRASYGHLAVFCGTAPERQLVALWAAVGKALHRALFDQPGEPLVWLSTEGSGVPWLHVRLDSRPKYYHHAPYKRQPDE